MANGREPPTARTRSGRKTPNAPETIICIFFFQAEDGIRDVAVTGVQTCALPISRTSRACVRAPSVASASAAPPAPRTPRHDRRRRSRLLGHRPHHPPGAHRRAGPAVGARDRDRRRDPRAPPESDLHARLRPAGRRRSDRRRRGRGGRCRGHRDGRALGVLRRHAGERAGPSRDDHRLGDQGLRSRAPRPDERAGAGALSPGARGRALGAHVRARGGPGQPDGRRHRRRRRRAHVDAAGQARRPRLPTLRQPRHRRRRGGRRAEERRRAGHGAVRRPRPRRERPWSRRACRRSARRWRWRPATASRCRSAPRSPPCSSTASPPPTRWRRCLAARPRAKTRRSRAAVPELRKDPVVGRWVIISTERARRPNDFNTEPVRPRGGPCVFCTGNEDKTPPEIVAVRPPDTTRDGPGWSLRVVPNKFPALRIEGDLEPSGEGLYDRMNGVGAHEVVIETPDHYASLATMSIDAVADVFLTFRDRILDLKKDPRFEYVLVFKNHGEAAGASLEHPHSQLIATPIIPIMVTEELAGSQQYWQRKERR